MHIAVPSPNQPDLLGVPLSKMGIQVTITDFALARWQANDHGIELTNLPRKPTFQELCLFY